MKKTIKKIFFLTLSISVLSFSSLLSAKTFKIYPEFNRSVIDLPASPCQANTLTFNYTGGVQNFTVPNGCQVASVVVKGAGGGSGVSFAVTPDGKGGNGGLVSGDLKVSSGQIYNVLVGGGGYSCAGGGGGGLSGIFNGQPSQSSAIIVAGGGGGAGNFNQSLNGTTGLVCDDGGDAGLNPSMGSSCGAIQAFGQPGYGFGAGGDAETGSVVGQNGSTFGSGGTFNPNWGGQGGFGGGGAGGSGGASGGGGSGFPGGFGGFSDSVNDYGGTGGAGGTDYANSSLVSNVKDILGGGGQGSSSYVTSSTECSNYHGENGSVIVNFK